VPSSPAFEVKLNDVTVGAVESIVTVLTDAADRLPAASTAYTVYEPSDSPVAEIEPLVFAVVIAAEFHKASAALVILA
jgi:hypothetical protein